MRWWDLFCFGLVKIVEMNLLVLWVVFVIIFLFKSFLILVLVICVFLIERLGILGVMVW